jgi:hypothetical protein
LIDQRHSCAEATPLHFLASATTRFSKPADLEFDAEARINECHNLSQLFRFAEKCEQIMTTYLSIAGMLVLVLFPVLIPAIITAFHILTGQQQTSTQDRVAANFPRRTASPRLAVPAMA